MYPFEQQAVELLGNGQSMMGLLIKGVTLMASLSVLIALFRSQYHVVLFSPFTTAASLLLWQAIP